MVSSLSVTIKRGVNTVVTGPYESGKTSLFRILYGLWPLSGGTLERPNLEKIFYVSLRPYLFKGTLRDQIIYPHSESMMQKMGKTDADLI